MPSIGTVTSLSEFNAYVEIGLSRVFHDTLPQHPKLYTAWLKEAQAKAFTEQEIVHSHLGPMANKDVGGTFVIDKPYTSSPKSFTLETFGLGWQMEYEIGRWDQYDVMSRMTKALTASGRYTQNVSAYAILNNAFSTSDSRYTIYNGEAICDNSHETLRGTSTWSNAPASNTALSYLGVQDAITAYYVLTNEDGMYVILEPKLLICHPSRKWIADTLLKSQYRPDNANMNLNTLSGEGYNVHCSPFLTSTTAWFFNAPKDKLEIKFVNGDDLMFRRDSQFSTMNQVYSVYASWRVGVLQAYGVYGTAGV